MKRSHAVSRSRKGKISSARGSDHTITAKGFQSESEDGDRQG